MASCAARLGSIHGGAWTRSRPLRSVHSCTARPPLLPSLNICCVCAACDRSRLLLLLWSQDRRASTARRYGSLLYTGRYHVERLGSSGASEDRRAASIPSSCCGTAVATVATSCSVGSSGQQSTSCLRRAETGCSGSMSLVFVAARTRVPVLGGVLQGGDSDCT